MIIQLYNGKQTTYPKHIRVLGNMFVTVSGNNSTLLLYHFLALDINLKVSMNHGSWFKYTKSMFGNPLENYVWGCICSEILEVISPYSNIVIIHFFCREWGYLQRHSDAWIITLFNMINKKNKCYIKNLTI